MSDSEKLDKEEGKRKKYNESITYSARVRTSEMDHKEEKRKFKNEEN